MFDLLTAEARRSLRYAQRRAGLRSADSIDLVDITHGLLVEGVWAKRLLLVAGADPHKVAAEFETPTPDWFAPVVLPTDFSRASKKALHRARTLADTYNHAVVASSHLFVACLSLADSTVGPIVATHGLEVNQLGDLVAAVCHSRHPDQVSDGEQQVVTIAWL